jgi:SAM-dependent methyltransferase
LKYDELKYWNNRVNPNTEHGGDIQDLLDWISSYIAPGDWVLDYGPGVGRIFPAYKDAALVIGMDVSRLYVNRVFEAAGLLLKSFSLVLLDSVFPETALDGFDIVVANMVLLHQRPDSVGRIMEMLGQMGKTVLVGTWMSNRAIPELAAHCFNHDYKKLCDEHELCVLDWNLNHENLRFAYEISRD